MNPNSRMIGKYELREILGRGGMAEVWKAFDTQLHRYVAIKLLHANLQNDPNFITRFEREAQAIASLSHPNIVQIYDFQASRQPESAPDNIICYMVMTYVEGQTLASYLRQTSQIAKIPPVGEIIHLFTSIGNAIDYAHQQHMIHRDIKPANILLDQRTEKTNPHVAHTMGEPILSDFGIAKMLGAATQTVAGEWLGTPTYVSPELARGESGTRASDIYSLGIILYQICTGVLPFQGENTQAILTQQINVTPIAPVLLNPNIVPALSAVILRSLAKDPTARFASASAMADALSEALASSPTLDFNQTQLVPKPSTYNIGRPTPLIPAPTPPPITPSATPVFLDNINMSPSTPSHHSPQQIYHEPAATQPQDRVSNPSLPPLLSGSPPQASPSIKVSPYKNTTRRNIMLGTALLLLLLLVGSSLGYFLLFSHGAASSTGIIGHAFFVSSGQLNEQSTQGITDELEIDLQNVPAPGPGKSYYGWLEADKGMNMVAPVLLGALPVKNGEVHYLYPGDQKHTNLLEITSRFLITEENADTNPNIPSPDSSTWRYSAELPQGQAAASSPDPNMPGMSELSVLTHLRHLLAEAPELQKVGLPGGLDIWLFRNTQKVLEWAGSARDDWETQDTALLHRQVVRILDYLDGLSHVQSDAPGEPTLVTSQLAQIGLLDRSKHQDPSLLYLIDFHLNAMILSPGFTTEQEQLATEIDTAIKNITSWLEQARNDAVQLVTLSQEELLKPSSLSLLDDMATQALDAFGGRINPDTGLVQEGVLQVHYNIQHLATFNIKKV